MKSELLFDARATLGEGTAWDTKTQTLYWVDILEKRIYADTELFIELDEFIGCLAPCKNGHLILGKRASFVDLEPATAQQTVLYTLTESANNRMNDGKCDPAGRLLAGTMAMDEKESAGNFYSFNGKDAEVLIPNVTISNGMAWSPDHKTFYYIDTPTRQVQAFDYDLKTGKIANPRVAINIPESFGWPDGMTSDLQGNLWIAMWGGAQITKWNPNTGQLLEKIPVPALNASCCVFGGKNMNELFITSARHGMSDEEIKKYPLSGGLFKVITNVEGMGTFEFG
ncbi:MAG: SMP-30/gluconolactonase/LRE family protein [Anaerolineales bacterium]|nr:SMP-30/gluconolactonase/LRE family protein [Anaerolineales bacterium]